MHSWAHSHPCVPARFATFCRPAAHTIATRHPAGPSTVPSLPLRTLRPARGARVDSMCDPHPCAQAEPMPLGLIKTRSVCAGLQPCPLIHNPFVRADAVPIGVIIMSSFSSGPQSWRAQFAAFCQPAAHTLATRHPVGPSTVPSLPLLGVRVATCDCLLCLSGCVPCVCNLLHCQCLSEPRLQHCINCVEIAGSR